jgi:hypothetical protein
VQAIVELNVGLKRIGMATYAKKEAGIVFKQLVIFQTTISVTTDKLLVSEEAVRVLGSRQ